MSHHQIDPKTIMASDDGEWVYVDSDDEKASPEAASVAPVPAISAPDDVTEVITAAECAVDERGVNSYADNTDEEDACSENDDEDNYSDYSNEGRLERAYESDEDLDQGDDEKTSLKAAFVMRVPCWASDDVTEVVAAADTKLCSGGVRDERGFKYWYAHKTYSDAEDACSDDEDACSDYSNEGRLERAYESDEDLDQVDDEFFQPAFTKLLDIADRPEAAGKDQVAGAAAAPTVDDYDAWHAAATEYLDEYHDGGSTYDRDTFMEILDGGGGYGDNSDYRYGVGGGYGISSNYYRSGGGYYGGLPDFNHGSGRGYCGSGHLSDFDYGSGRDDGHLSDYDYGSGRGYYGGLSDMDYSSSRGYYFGLPDFDHGSSRAYCGGGQDFDYGSGRDDGHLSDYDYGSGRGYYGGLSDFDYSSRRGYHGGISDFHYGGRCYCHEGYNGHRYRGHRYPGELDRRMYRPYYMPRAGIYPPLPMSQYNPFSNMPEAPAPEAEPLGSWA